MSTFLYFSIDNQRQKEYFSLKYIQFKYSLFYKQSY